ncbi:hypothetical protein OG607_16625 [Streptomyces sp. NBC_01537]|uniref:hypothetical protein n=1 Tax=Streptomyces sp. NBC_01537 TaxID=2903896 RepID=UPI00386901C2
MAEETEFHDAALDPGQAARFTRTLRKVTESGVGGPDLQDLARRLLSGRMELGDVLDSPAGARALGAGLDPLRSKWEALPEQERQAIRDERPGPEETREPGRDGREGAGPRGRRPRGQAPSSGPRHGGGWSAY